MSVNSFDSFFLSWVPELLPLKRPQYLHLANALEADIISGKIAAGTKLPPQRELADFLNINFTTVTRAYGLCRERNLIYGVTGRGTFVAPMPGSGNRQYCRRDMPVIELGVVKGFEQLKTPVIEASQSVLQKGYIEELYSYTEPAGHLHQRAAGAHWMAQMDVHTDSEHTAIFSGAQNAISAAFLTLFRIGDKVAVDEYTYSNLIGTARLSHIRLVPVAGDSGGMRPEILADICRREDIRGIFLMPNCANPTTVTISEERKDQLAEIIRKNELILIEDDNTGIPTLPDGGYHTMFSRLPEQSIYICSSTMALCSGLRVAFAAFPEAYRSQLLNGLFHLSIKTSSLDAEIMTELILSGKAWKILEQKRGLAVARNRIFDEVFPEAVTAGTEAAFFRWLPFRSMNLTGMEIEQELQKRNVNVYCAYRFSIQRNPGSFMRLAIASPGSDSELRRGLHIVKEFLQEKSS